MGLEIGAKALTLLYFPGFLKNKVKAPWPPSSQYHLHVRGDTH